MFVIFGLVIGSLVGFVTSLFRARAMRQMLVASNITCGVVGLLSLATLVVTKNVGRGGDAAIASLTIVAITVGSLISILVVCSLIGGLSCLTNSHGFVKNARSIVIDVVVLSVVFIVAQAMILNGYSQSEIADKKRTDAGARQRIDELNGQIPFEYREMDTQALRELTERRPSQRVPEEVFDKIFQRESLKNSIATDYGLAQFNRTNERRISLLWSSTIGWLLTILFIPISIKQKQKPTQPPQPG